MRLRPQRHGFAALALLAAVLAMAACSESQDPGADTEVASATAEEFYPFDTPPVLKTYPTPEYPEAARRAGLEGRVAVKVLVGSDGSVVETTVLSASDDIFAEAAQEAMARARFEPALKDGKATRSQVMVPVEFKLQ